MSTVKPANVLCGRALVALFLIAAGSPAGAGSSQGAPAAGTDDAVLRKLDELQTEMRNLKTEVAGLRKALVDATTAAAAAAAAQPPSGGRIALDSKDQVLGSITFAASTPRSSP